MEVADELVKFGVTTLVLPVISTEVPVAHIHMFSLEILQVFGEGHLEAVDSLIVVDRVSITHEFVEFFDLEVDVAWKSRVDNLAEVIFINKVFEGGRRLLFPD